MSLTRRATTSTWGVSRGPEYSQVIDLEGAAPTMRSSARAIVASVDGVLGPDDAARVAVCLGPTSMAGSRVCPTNQPAMPNSTRDRPTDVAALEFVFGLREVAPQIRTLTSTLVDVEAACAFAGGSVALNDVDTFALYRARASTGKPSKAQSPKHADAWRRAHAELVRLRPTVLRVAEFNQGSLRLLLELPWGVYATAGAALITAVGTMFGAPHRASAAIEQARFEYWTKRLEADKAKARYIAWRRDQNAMSGVELYSLDVPSLPPGSEETT